MKDNQGNIVVRKGDVITPLPLDTLDRMGMLDQVRVKGTFAEPKPEPARHGEPEVHLVLESFAEHEQHRASI